MGIFSFLKQLSSKKAQKEPEIVEITLDASSQWIDSKAKIAYEDVNQKLKEIRDSITAEKQKLNESIQGLMNAELKNTSIPDRIKRIRVANRDSYVQKVNMLAEKFNLPQETHKIIEFSNAFETSLNEFTTGTMRNYAILQEFFGNESSAVAANIRNFAVLTTNAKKITEEAGLDKMDELKEGVQVIQKKIKRKQELKDTIKMAEKQLDNNAELIQSNARKMKELEIGSDYKKFLDLVDNKSTVEQQLEDLKKQLFHSFSVIESALKKYERLTLDDAIVRRYLDSSLKALLEDHEFKIVELFAKMKDAINEGTLELKDKKKEKITQELQNLDRSYLESFLGKYKELNDKLSTLQSDIQGAEVKQLKELQEDSNQTTKTIQASKKNINAMNDEFNSINIEELTRNLEHQINTQLNEKVKIIL